MVTSWGRKGALFHNEKPVRRSTSLLSTPITHTRIYWRESSRTHISIPHHGHRGSWSTRLGMVCCSGTCVGSVANSIVTRTCACRRLATTQQPHTHALMRVVSRCAISQAPGVCDCARVESIGGRRQEGGEKAGCCFTGARRYTLSMIHHTRDAARPRHTLHG